MNEKPKFTPGPWHLINDCCVGGPIKPGWEAAGSGIAACGMQARTRDEAAANARLIAAGPDMYEALEMIRDGDDDCRKDGLPTMSEFARARIDAALAKAEGRS